MVKQVSEVRNDSSVELVIMFFTEITMGLTKSPTNSAHISSAGSVAIFPIIIKVLLAVRRNSCSSGFNCNGRAAARGLIGRSILRR